MVFSAETLNFPRVMLPELLLEHNLNNDESTKPAIIDGMSGEIAYTFSSFRSAVRKVANHFQSDVTLRRGTVVGILEFNSNDFPVLVHGILAAGGVVSAFNPFHRPQEISHYLSLARPEVIFVGNQLADLLAAGLSLAKLDYAPEIYVRHMNEEQCLRWKAFSLSNIIENGIDIFAVSKSAPQSESNKPAFICFSSGTTGPMKGVRLTHENMVANIFQHRKRLGDMFTTDTVAALITPFFHILGLGVFVCQYLCQGIPIVVFPKFDLPSILAAVPRHRITHLNIVPPIALQLLKSTDKATDISSLRCLINAAAPLKEEISSELSRRIGCRITQWYGMTEASPSVVSQREDEIGISGTVGKLLPGMTMRIIGSDGEECGFNQVGELQIQGPNIMLGYLGTERPNSSDFVDGYFKTGDLGYIDESGYVFLVGRAKEMIKVKGSQVAPAELESILLSHPKVHDAAVQGIYFDEQATEYPAAYIAIGPEVVDYESLKQDVQAYVDKQVASYKRLRGGVHIVRSIPRNASGKILRNSLADTPRLDSPIRSAKM